MSIWPVVLYYSVEYIPMEAYNPSHLHPVESCWLGYHFDLTGAEQSCSESIVVLVVDEVEICCCFCC